MNTYSSVKSFDSQIQGRRMQEPNIAVMHSRHQQSPKYHSPEQHLDQIVNLKLIEPVKTLKKKKLTQGVQGKPTPLPKTTKKIVQQSVSVKKKRTVSPKKKKPHTVDVKKKTIKVSQQERREQLGIGYLNEKQIKQRIKKIKSKDRSVEPEQKKKHYHPNQSLQNYISQKKVQDNTSSMQQQLITLLEKQRKLENLAKLNESVKEIFKKCKTLENSQPQTPKLVIKKRKTKNEKVVEKKKQLKQQFNDLSQRYQNIQQPLPIDEEVEDQYSQVSDNQLSQQIIETLKEFPPTQYLLEKISQILQEQNDIDPNQLTDQDFLVLQYHFMNEAAVKLQSVWRGVSIRKQLLHELQEMLGMQQHDEYLVEEEPSNENDEQQTDYGEEPAQVNEEDDQEVEFYEQQQNKKQNHSYEEPEQIIQKQQQKGQTKKLSRDEQKQEQFEDKNKFSKKISDQTDDLVIIQQPNSPANQELYFYNPFNQNQQSAEKQIHYSNIKSSIVSEDDQKSVLSSSVLQQIQQELELWNSQIENILKQGQEKQAFANVKQQMSQTILNIVSQHMKKQKETKNHERRDSEQSVELRLRNLQEANNERTFNDARKRLQKSQEYSEEILQLSQKEIQNEVNRSSLMSLQSQLMKKETELLNMREEAINLRYKAEQKKLQNDSTKKQELDTWLEKELEDLKNTKQAIEISRKREANALKKTQRDIQIAQAFDENNPKLQSLKKQVDEQFSNLKQQKTNSSDIKIINHFDMEQNEDLDQMPDSLSEDQRPDNEDQRNVLRENIIESDKQIETYQTISVITNDILDDIIHNLTEELLINKLSFEYIISNLISQSVSPQLPTSIEDIKNYIKSFFEFALQNHRDEILRNLNTSYGFTPFKRMQLIHGYDNEEENEDEFHAENSQQIQNQIAFPLDESLFLEYEQHRLQEDNDADATSYAMKELEHIHNKAIFDACNEALNYFRPYFYNSGLTYPWENRQCNAHYIEEDLRDILQRMEDRVISWAGTLGGFLPVEDDYQVPQEKQEILDEKNQQIMLQQLHKLENPLLYDSQLSQQMFDHLAQIRDERLYKMLIADIKENEFRWYLAEDDKTEFLMELSDMIFEQLVEEMASEQLQQ